MTRPKFLSRRAAAATAWCRSPPRRMCLAAAPTGAAAGAAAASSSWSAPRREAHVPRGGPDGGDGGRGGDIVLVCDSSRRDLVDLRRNPHLRAGRGGHGQGSQKHGARGEDREVPVPPGTLIEGLEGERYDL